MSDDHEPEANWCPTCGRPIDEGRRECDACAFAEEDYAIIAGRASPIDAGRQAEAPIDW